MKRVILAVFVVMTLGWGSAASADAPVEFSDSVTFEDVNVCTGEVHEVTLNFVIDEHHGHNNNFVVHLRRSGSTSDGYTMIAGNEQVAEGEQGFRAHFMDMWSNGEGSKFKVSGRVNFNANTGDVVTEDFSFRCISGG